MRYAVLLVALLTSASFGQKPPELPKKAATELRAITAKITETPGVVIERNAGEFTKTKLVASDVEIEPLKSEYADKPIAAKVRWKSIAQNSVIYSSKEAAEKAKDWLKPGHVTKNVITKSLMHVATYYYVDGKWVLDEITWAKASTAKGSETKWTAVLGEAAKKPK